MLRAIHQLPENAAIEDPIEQLYLLHKIERGVAQVESGQKVSGEEACQSMARWLEKAGRTKD